MAYCDRWFGYAPIAKSANFFPDSRARIARLARSVKAAIVQLRIISRFSKYDKALSSAFAKARGHNRNFYLYPMQMRIRTFKTIEEQGAYHPEPMRNTTPIERLRQLYAVQQMTQLLHPNTDLTRKLIVRKRMA